VFTPGEEQFCITVIFKLGSPNKQINRLNDEAKNKHKSTPVSTPATNQPTWSHSGKRSSYPVKKFPVHN